MRGIFSGEKVAVLSSKLPDTKACIANSQVVAVERTERDVERARDFSVTSVMRWIVSGGLRGILKVGRSRRRGPHSRQVMSRASR